MSIRSFTPVFVLVIFFSATLFVAKHSSAQTVVPDGFLFEKNLAYRDRVYPDVNYLQIFLNMDKQTAVAQSGPGSNDQITSFFGTKTVDAVKRFQQLYYKDILEPAGLTEPNGFFGLFSRTKANSLLATSASTTVASTTCVDCSTATTTSSTNTDDQSSDGSSAAIGAGIGAGVATIASGLLSSGGTGSIFNFGGMVIRYTQCTCGPSSMLDIMDVRGQMTQLVYTPGISRIYMYYNIYGTGQNVLGTYTPGGVCLVYVGTGCTSQGIPRGTIQMIGTSQ